MNKKAFLILAFALMAVMFGFGMVIPIFPFYITELGAGGSELGLLVATAALLEFLFGPLWGCISDRVGRKPVLMVGLFGYAVSTFLFGISSQLWMLFAARALSGVLSSATITAAMAYVSDITGEDSRGEGMGRIGAAMALGVMLGPGLGGWLAEDSLALPFFIAAGVSLLSLLFAAVFLPESHAPAGRTKGQTLQLPDVKTLWKAVRGPAGILFLLVAVFSFALTNFESVFGLYALEKFGYGPERVGTILLVVAAVSTFGKALLTGPVVRRWGERTTIQASLLAGSAGFLILLAAWDFPTTLAATGFFILSKTLLRPAALALISRRSGDDQGAAMGLSNSFMSLGRILGPIWAGLAFDLGRSLPYLSGSALMLAAFLFSMRALRMQRVHRML